MKRVAVLVLTILLTTGCTLATQSGEADEPRASEDGSPREVVLVTHESFALPKKLVRRFEAESDLDLTIRAAGDAGSLTNKLVLTTGDPTGDLAFGIDNTFASRALEAGVFVTHDTELPPGAEKYALPGGEAELVPVDNASVCVNVDTSWFEERDLAPPTSLDQLTDPAYKGLFVTPGASTSSPGMAFLLATIATYGDRWGDYWVDLMANDAKVTSGWSDAYYVDYTLGGEQGTRPIVVSYDSSPAFTLTDDSRRSRSVTLLDSCFRQVEYAGILAGAANPEGARRVIAWLLGRDVQAALPRSMYVFPVRADVTLPADWARFAVQPERPLTLDPAEITAHREQWLTQWTDLTSR